MASTATAKRKPTPQPMMISIQTARCGEDLCDEFAERGGEHAVEECEVNGKGNAQPQEIDQSEQHAHCHDRADRR